MRANIFGFILLLASWAAAQTVTTTDDLGNTIVEEITTDPILGNPTTVILESIPAVATTSATVATTAAADPGPVVGQPAPTGPGSPTVYTYTTTDANGDYTAIIDTFTPTYYQSEQSPTPFTGTILNYSSWLAMVGTNTVASQVVVSGATGPVRWTSGGWYGVLTAVTSVFGGVILVLA